MSKYVKDEAAIDKAMLDIFKVAGALQDFRTEGVDKPTKVKAAKLLAEYGWEDGIAYLAELEVLEVLGKEDSDV